jgi:hypothetical protein
MSDGYVMGASPTIPRSGGGLVVPTNQVEDQRLEIRNHSEEAAARGEIVPKHATSSLEAYLWEYYSLEYDMTQKLLLFDVTLPVSETRVRCGESYAQDNLVCPNNYRQADRIERRSSNLLEQQ